jgi:hypothetical protein
VLLEDFEGTAPLHLLLKRRELLHARPGGGGARQHDGPRGVAAELRRERWRREAGRRAHNQRQSQQHFLRDDVISDVRGNVRKLLQLQMRSR